MMAYVAPCNLPNFQQMRPDFDKLGTADDRWELVTSDQAHALTYRHKDTGEEIVCPSIWYNQPVAWRARYFRFCADRAEVCAANLEAQSDWRGAPSWEVKKVAEYRADAVRLRALADEMDRTGRFPNA